MQKPIFVKRHISSAPAGNPWAGKMVLNPAMIRDDQDSHTIHMLFRATGAYPQAQIAGKPLPYPIFIGYAVSHDDGKNWEFDFSQPAFKPALSNDPACLYTFNAARKKVFNYANGAAEDPRLMYFEDELYLTIAARSFPPGPYWDRDAPQQCMPDWVQKSDLNVAVRENYTVTLLYKVSLEALCKHEYDKAFTLIAPLHEPTISDDRDVMLFPRRLEINGKRRIVCIHRPKFPWNYAVGKELTAPSIFLAAADNLEDFSQQGKAERIVFAKAEFEWEANRIGTSWPPMEIAPGEWLLPYHGKQDDKVGYTQSFMLLRENGTLNLDIVKRPAERLLYADEPWELEGDFTTPCLFSCSGVLLDNGDLLMGYGAADTKIGLVSTSFKELIAYLKKL